MTEIPRLANRIVSFPDPTLKEGKVLVYIKRFLGLDDFQLGILAHQSDSYHAVYMWLDHTNLISHEYGRVTFLAIVFTNVNNVMLVLQCMRSDCVQYTMR